MKIIYLTILKVMDKILKRSGEADTISFWSLSGPWVAVSWLGKIKTDVKEGMDM